MTFFLSFFVFEEGGERDVEMVGMGWELGRRGEGVMVVFMSRDWF